GRAAHRVGGVGEGPGAVGLERAGARGRAVPDADLLALLEQRAREARSEQAGSEDGDHAGSLARRRGGGRFSTQPVARSWTRAGGRQRGAPWCGAMIWIPIGRPVAPKPAGTFSAGQPAMVAGMTTSIQRW